MIDTLVQIYTPNVVSWIGDTCACLIVLLLTYQKTHIHTPLINATTQEEQRLLCTVYSLLYLTTPMWGSVRLAHLTTTLP